MPIDKTLEADLRYQLALLRAPEVGPQTFYQLMNRFETAKALFTDERKTLHLLGLDASTLSYLKSANWQEVDEDLEWLENPNHHLVTYQQAHYPYLLKQIAGSPPILFVKGSPKVLLQPQLAMVGSRNPTPTGRDLAECFAYALGKAGLTITSGLALGIDAASHEGALKAGVNTVAVLGNGLKIVYPHRHKVLSEAIVAQGALVSEFPLNHRPHPSYFPRRNRVISGLSMGTLVVEAALNSGSLITAKHAGDQGRELFAIPGSIQNPLSKGCHSLIKLGAKLVESPADVLEELGPMASFFQMSESVSQQDLATNPKLDSAHQKLVECIGFETTSVDQIVIRSGLSTHRVASMLLNIELHGYIRRVSGGYMRVRQ